MAMSAAREFNTVAATCRCAFLMPLPNSADPAARWKVPSASSDRWASERCSVGGAQSCAWMATPLAFQPFVAVGFGLAPAAGEGLFDEIEALIQPIAADHAVVREGPDAVNGIVRPDHVLAPNREWVDTQLAGQLVDGALDGERTVVSRRIRGRRPTAPYSCRPHSRCPFLLAQV